MSQYKDEIAPTTPPQPVRVLKAPNAPPRKSKTKTIRTDKSHPKKKLDWSSHTSKE